LQYNRNYNNKNYKILKTGVAFWQSLFYADYRGETMYIIVGLGNPGSKYKTTRHNTGYRAVEVLAERFHITFTEKKHKALLGKGIINGEKVILVKPETFMNLSGESVRELLDYYRVEEKTNLIVLYDDISLAPGQLRIRKKGSAGGHNGIKNIILMLGHEVFLRVKIGVGEKPAGYDLADYVLGHFNREESAIMEEALTKTADAVVMIMEQGADKAMNHFNGEKQ